MAAMLLVTAYAAGDNQVSANPVNQQVIVTVPEAIAISVQTPVSFGNVSAGTYNVSSPNYTINNTGNVRIDLYAKTNATAFTSSTAIDNIPILNNYYIKNNNTGNFVQVSTSSVKIYDNMNKASPGAGTPHVWNTAGQRLTIPSYTEEGTYSIGLIYTAVKRGGTAPP
jgi:hypothetical protein